MSQKVPGTMAALLSLLLFPNTRKIQRKAPPPPKYWRDCGAIDIFLPIAKSKALQTEAGVRSLYQGPGDTRVIY